MLSFISTFITVGICLGIYAYIKKKYSAQIQLLENQISELNLEIVKAKTRARELDNTVLVKEREVSSYKTRLETMIEINKGLTASKSITPNLPVEEVKTKRGRKPGTKKPYYKKKSGGSPS